MKVLAAHERGRSPRVIAVALWGAAEVRGKWHTDGWMRSRIKRRLRKARGILDRYREIVAGG